MNPGVINPQRQCATREGIPKKAFATWDAAMELLSSRAMDSSGMHVYRCAEHGFHLGHVVRPR